MSPFNGKAPRNREYHVLDWQVFSRIFRESLSGGDLKWLVANSAKAATVVTKAQQGQPVSDIKHLALRAARRGAQRQALKGAVPELWAAFVRIDAVC